LTVQFSLSCGQSGIPVWEIAIAVIIPVTILVIGSVFVFYRRDTLRKHLANFSR